MTQKVQINSGLSYLRGPRGTGFRDDARRFENWERSDCELTDRLAGIEQIEDAVARGDAADFGRRIALSLDEEWSSPHPRL